MKAKIKPVKGSARTQKFDRGGTVAALAGLGTLAYLMSRKKKGEDGKSESRSPVSGPVPGMQGGQGDLAPSMVDTTSKVDEAAKRRAMAASMGRPEMGGGDKSVMDSDATATRASTPTAKKPTAKKPAAKKPAGPTTRGLYRPLATSDDKPSAAKTTPAAPKLKPGESKTVGEGSLKPYPEKEAANVLGERNLKPFPEKKATPTTTKTTKPTEAAATKAKPTEATKKKKDSESGMGPKNTFLTKERQEKARKAYFGKKDGGAVKKYADGGTTSSKPAPKKAPMPAFAREAKENRERDQRVKKEREEFDKGAPTRLKDQGSFKHGGMTASKRGDGIAMRGKTKGKMY
jgi:hypothetical protein